MALSERLAYILDFNVQGAVKSLEQVGKTADKELGKADQKLDKLGGNLTKFGAGAVAFAGAAGVGLFKLASGAAEAEANTAALRQVVDEVAAVEIEKWAENSAVAVGLANKEAIAATTSFAGLGKIINLSGPELTSFSTGLVQMAADMAAFKDVSPEKALQDLQSIFAGSTEVGRQYNIFLDDATLKSAYFRETGEQVSGTLTSQQRIIATNSELYRQGADMIGQWGRESDGLAGQQAQLRANLIDLGDSIGAGVLPMVNQMVGALNKGAAAFSSLSPEVQSTIGKFAAFGVAGVGMLGTLSLVAGQLIKMRDRFSTLDVDTQTRSLNNFGKAAKGLGVALGIAGAALVVYQLNAAAAADDVNDLADGLAATARQGDEAAAATVQQITALGSITGDLKPAIDQFVTGNIEAAKRLIETGAAAEGGAEFLDLLTKAVKAEEEARAQNTAVLEEHADVVAEDTAAVEENTAKIGGPGAAAQKAYEESLLDAAAASRASKKATEEKTKADEEAAEAAQEHRRRVDELYGALMQLVGGDIAVREAQRQASQATNEYRDAAANAETTTEELAAAQDNAASAILGAAQAAADNEIATREAAGEALSMAEKTDIQRTALEAVARTLEPGSPLRQQIDGYVTELGEVPTEVRTAMVADVDAASLAAAEAALVELARERSARIKIKFSGGNLNNDGTISFGGPGGSVETAGAEGGIINRPTVLLAGEAGPEALIPLHKSAGNGPLPTGLGGGPVDQTRGMLGGRSGPLVHIEHADFRDELQAEALASLLLARTRVA